MQKVKYKIEPMDDNGVNEEVPVFGRTTGLFKLERWDCDPTNPKVFHFRIVVRNNLTFEEAQNLQNTLLNPAAPQTDDKTLS